MHLYLRIYFVLFLFDEWKFLLTKVLFTRWELMKCSRTNSQWFTQFDFVYEKYFEEAVSPVETPHILLYKSIDRMIVLLL